MAYRKRSRGRSAYKAGLRRGKRKARAQMSRFIPMMQRVGIRR
jgi:hypothetical protein